MKRHLMTTAALVALFFLMGALPAWSQTVSVQGTVIGKDGNPLAGAVVLMEDPTSGKKLELKTDDKGKFSSIGVSPANYQLSITPPGDAPIAFALLKVSSTDSENKPVVINLQHPEKSSGNYIAGEKKLSKEEIAKIEAQNAKATSMNTLIKQAQDAMNAKQWEQAIPPLQQLTQQEPASWQFWHALGDSQSGGNHFEDAVQSYQKGIAAGEAVASGNIAPGLKGAESDPAKAKAAVSEMLESEANAYLKLNKPAEAVPLFTKAAETSPNPARAYFNLCVTLYNTSNMDGAVQPCEKAIAADPTRADAYFIKGAALFQKGKMEGQKYIPAPGAVEALQKYAELAPDGRHIAEVKDMLAASGATIQTTYKSKKK